MASRADSQNTPTTKGVAPEHTLSPAAELEEHTRQVEYLSRAVRILAWDLSEKRSRTITAMPYRNGQRIR